MSDLEQGADESDLRGPFLGRPLRGERRRRRYEAPDDLVTAASVALHLQMPLLLTGEPGCGKTDFAWAAASALAAAQARASGADDHAVQQAALRAEPLSCYVRSESRARDLLYHYDALGRFGDGQHGQLDRARDVHHYLRLEPLGQALLSSRRRVVLIDEIDKAPRDLPNDLLRELDQGHFDIPEIPPDAPLGPALGAAAGEDLAGVRLQRRMQRQEERPMPLVIITSNQERQLPDPFLRRCVFFHIPFPEEPAMRKIIAAYFGADAGDAGAGGGAGRAAGGGAVAGSVRRAGGAPLVEPPGEPLVSRALTLFYRLRAETALVKRPATVELLGFLAALRLLLRRGVDVLAALDPLCAKEAAATPIGALPWGAVPALGCLIKLREDRDTLKVGEDRGKKAAEDRAKPAR